MSDQRPPFRILHYKKPEREADKGVVWNPRFKRCGLCVDFAVSCQPMLDQPEASRKCVFWGAKDRGRFKEAE